MPSFTAQGTEAPRSEMICQGDKSYGRAQAEPRSSDPKTLALSAPPRFLIKSMTKKAITVTKPVPFSWPGEVIRGMDHKRDLSRSNLTTLFPKQWICSYCPSTRPLSGHAGSLRGGAAEVRLPVYEQPTSENITRKQDQGARTPTYPVSY